MIQGVILSEDDHKEFIYKAGLYKDLFDMVKVGSPFSFVEHEIGENKRTVFFYGDPHQAYLEKIRKLERKIEELELK